MPDAPPVRHHPWCVEHDPSGTCLGDVIPLPHAGAAWIEGGERTSIAVALGRRASGRRRTPVLGPADARALASALVALADRIDHE